MANLESPLDQLLNPTDNDRHESHEEEGTALCLSGGGYRAMLFHVGSLWRLNEIGILGKLKRISSVSGGSITAGVLGMNWGSLGISDANPTAPKAVFQEALVQPICKLASTDIDALTIGRGILSWRKTVSELLVDAYAKHLFGKQTLQDLPDSPRFVINATNLRTGSLWRFSKPYMGDWRIGRIDEPETPLATAVAASSAFPPFLSPLRMQMKKSDFAEIYLKKSELPPDLQADYESFLIEAVLSDGGVYDNLGLETAWKRYRDILISDAGKPYELNPDPSSDWIRHSRELLDLVYEQVGKLRRRQAVSAFTQKRKKGCYWGIGVPIDKYDLPTAIKLPPALSSDLKNEPTRLAAIDAARQKELINWGYVACDTSVRKHYLTDTLSPASLPF